MPKPRPSVVPPAWRPCWIPLRRLVRRPRTSSGARETCGPAWGACWLSRRPRRGSPAGPGAADPEGVTPPADGLADLLGPLAQLVVGRGAPVRRLARHRLGDGGVRGGVRGGRGAADPRGAGCAVGCDVGARTAAAGPARGGAAEARYGPPDAAAEPAGRAAAPRGSAASARPGRCGTSPTRSRRRSASARRRGCGAGGSAIGSSGRSAGRPAAVLVRAAVLRRALRVVRGGIGYWPVSAPPWPWPVSGCGRSGTAVLAVYCCGSDVHSGLPCGPRGPPGIRRCGAPGAAGRGTGWRAPPPELARRVVAAHGGELPGVAGTAELRRHRERTRVTGTTTLRRRRGRTGVAADGRP